MSKSKHPQRAQLRMLALRLQLDNLSPQEKALLAHALRVMAEGGDFEEALGAKRPQGRPENNKKLAAAQYVAWLMQPKSDNPLDSWAGEGLTKKAAIERAAVFLNMSPETVEDACKPPVGRAGHDAMRARAEELSGGFDAFIDTPLE